MVSLGTWIKLEANLKWLEKKAWINTVTNNEQLYHDVEAISSFEQIDDEPLTIDKILISSYFKLVE